MSESAMSELPVHVDPTVTQVEHTASSSDIYLQIFIFRLLHELDIGKSDNECTGQNSRAKLPIPSSSNLAALIGASNPGALLRGSVASTPSLGGGFPPVTGGPLPAPRLTLRAPLLPTPVALPSSVVALRISSPANYSPPVNPRTNLTPTNGFAEQNEFVDDEEEESLKRQPKKQKKELNTELMYKSPLEDLQFEACPTYGRNPPRRKSRNGRQSYPSIDRGTKNSSEGRTSRWDARNNDRRPERDNPRFSEPKYPPNNQEQWGPSGVMELEAPLMKPSSANPSNDDTSNVGSREGATVPSNLRDSANFTTAGSLQNPAALIGASNPGALLRGSVASTPSLGGGFPPVIGGPLPAPRLTLRAPLLPTPVALPSSVVALRISSPANYSPPVNPRTNLTPTNGFAEQNEFVDDDEEESLKRQPKKQKKELNTELMYKSPLEDLQFEARPIYGRNPPRRKSRNGQQSYPSIDRVTKNSSEGRTSRWDARNNDGRPERDNPRFSEPKHPPNNQDQWGEPQMNERLNAIPSDAHLSLLPKTINLNSPPITKIYAYFNHGNPQILDIAPPTYDPNEKASTMVDPMGQLPRPTSGLTRDYFNALPDEFSLEDLVSHPYLALSDIIHPVLLDKTDNVANEELKAITTGDSLENNLHCLPALKEQYSFKKNTVNLEDDDSSDKPIAPPPPTWPTDVDLSQNEKDPPRRKSRNGQQSYPSIDRGTKNSSEGRTSRWDARNNDRRPERDNPRFSEPKYPPNNQDQWGEPQMNERLNAIPSDAHLSLLPKTINLNSPPITKIYAYFNHGNPQILDIAPPTYDPNEKASTMVDPMGQLPRPTSGLTRDYFNALPDEFSLEDLVSHPYLALSDIIHPVLLDKTDNVANEELKAITTGDSLENNLHCLPALKEQYSFKKNTVNLEDDDSSDKPIAPPPPTWPTDVDLSQKEKEPDKTAKPVEPNRSDYKNWRNPSPPKRTKSSKTLCPKWRKSRSNSPSRRSSKSSPWRRYKSRSPFSKGSSRSTRSRSNSPLYIRGSSTSRSRELSRNRGHSNSKKRLGHVRMLKRSRSRSPAYHKGSSSTSASRKQHSRR